MSPLSLRFGLTTKVSAQQTAPSLSSNMALLSTKTTYDQQTSAIQDSHDPITVDVQIDANGQAVSSITTKNSRQKQSITMTDNNRAAEFWQATLDQVLAMVPKLKSLEQLRLDTVNQAKDQVFEFAAAIEQADFQHLETEVERGFGDSAASQTARFLHQGKTYSLHLKDSGYMVFQCPEQNLKLELAKSWDESSQPSFLNVRVEKDREWGFELQPKGTTPVDVSIQSLMGKIDWMIGLFKANGYMQ